MQESGYHYSFLNNIFIFFMMGGVILLSWAIMLCVNYRRPRKLNAFMTNFQLRFLYELVFEITLCAVLYLTYTKVSITFGICVLCVIGLSVCLLFCLSRGIKNGPYLEKCYQKGTLVKSFW